ncbi:MAG: peptide chain release factor 1 [Candidatus Hydrogenedentota bacterium]
MRDKLRAQAEEYERLSQMMSTQEVASDPGEYRRHAQAQAGLQELVETFRRYEAEEKRLEDAKSILEQGGDPELCELAEQEREELQQSLEELEHRLKLLLIPKDPNDDKNTIVEIRAGTGGEEAALFAADLYNMYMRYAELQNWRIELLSSHATGLGGYKEISFKVAGKGAYSQLKYEAGVHRVQRVPETETQGRIHTSAVTVAVLPEAEEVDVGIDPNDLRIDVFRSSGAGGQHVNTTDSAVRITHLPTGVAVSCQDEKSQHKNKAKGMTILRARLLARKQAEEDAARSAHRKNQVGSGDRSERIRTYNFPQNRITDHRINMTLYQLDKFMEGEMQEMIDALATHYQTEQMTAEA